MRSTSAMFRPLPADLQRLLVVARAVAGRARRVDARHEQQLDADEALALAGLAAALGDVEGEAAGVVAARARRRRRGEQLAHVVEQAGVGGEVGARRAADRLLVDAHQAARCAPCRPRCGRAVSLGDRRLGVVGLRRRLRPGSWPRCAPTSSTSAWLTRLDLPEPETPVTAVSTPSGKRASSVVQVVAGDAAQLEPAAAARAARAARGCALARTGSARCAMPRRPRRPAGGPL